jgi:hypothetical protein
MLVHAGSLSRTVDAINAAVFERTALPRSERQAAAGWIVARQGQPGAYADTFAGFPVEREKGIVVFTGERITSASARHILGEEACRALRLLDVRGNGVETALDRADRGLMRSLERAAEDPRHTNPGLFCCGKCSVGLWRNLLAGGLDRQDERLRRGAGHLRSMRDGEGQWRRFPFWYTVLALTDMDVPEAAKELKYTAVLLENAVRRAPGSTPTSRRRRELAERALGRT